MYWKQVMHGAGQAHISTTHRSTGEKLARNNPGRILQTRRSSSSNLYRKIDVLIKCETASSLKLPVRAPKVENVRANQPLSEIDA